MIAACHYMSAFKAMCMSRKGLLSGLYDLKLSSDLPIPFLQFDAAQSGKELLPRPQVDQSQASTELRRPPKSGYRSSASSAFSAFL
jgi:hypothetical protein